MSGRFITEKDRKMFICDDKLKKLCQVIQIDIDGLNVQKPIGDGQFIEEWHSIMITDKYLVPSFHFYGIIFDKTKFTPKICVTGCEKISDDLYRVNIKGWIENEEG